MSNTPLSPILSGKTTEGGGAVTPSALLSATASMTPEQKAELRANIGATDAETSIPDNVKQALLDCFAHVAWVDEHGQDYVDSLTLAMYPLDHITAVYTQSGTVYDTDSLDSLKADLVVTAVYESGNTKTVDADDYTLSGTLVLGTTSTITVSYGGETATFDVVVSELLYAVYNHVCANDNFINTGKKLLQSDRDISIAINVNFAGQQSGTTWSVFACINGTSPWAGLCIQSWRTNSNDMMIQNMTNQVQTSGTNFRGYVGNFKYIVTHTAGSGKWHYYYKIGSNAVVNQEVTSAYATVNGNLYVGGVGSQSFNGTFHSFEAYPRVLTSEEINEFMG